VADAPPDHPATLPREEYKNVEPPAQKKYRCPKGHEFMAYASAFPVLRSEHEARLKIVPICETCFYLWLRKTFPAVEVK
jgi:hypothetical protein